MAGQAAKEKMFFSPIGLTTNSWVKPLFLSPIWEKSKRNRRFFFLGMAFLGIKQFKMFLSVSDCFCDVVKRNI